MPIFKAEKQQAAPVESIGFAGSSDEAPPAYDNRSLNHVEVLPPPPSSMIDYPAYSPPGATISQDLTTTYIVMSDIWNNPEAILDHLEKQAALPPQPIVRIKGTHTDWVYSYGNLRTDFDLRLDITNLVVPTPSTNLTYRTVHDAPGLPSEASLRHWVERFSDGQESSLVLERSVPNWNTKFIEETVSDLVKSTKYKGTVEITFPLQHSNVVFKKSSVPEDPTHSDSSATIPSQKWYPSLTRLGSSSPAKTQPITLMQACWPYASTASLPSSSFNPALIDDGTKTVRSFAVQSEESWFNTWREPIRNGIVERKVGWVTLEDWKDVHMCQLHNPQPGKDWGTIGDDWSLAMKGVNVRGKKQDAPGNYLRGMYRGIKDR